MRLDKLDPLNYTLHSINLHVGDDVISYPPNGKCWIPEDPESYAFVRSRDGNHEIHGWNNHRGAGGEIKVIKRGVYRNPSWTPSPPPYGSDVMVSLFVASKISSSVNSFRIFVPDTSTESVVRDSNRRIIGVRRLILYHDPFAATHRLRVVSEDSRSLTRVYSRHLCTPGGFEEAYGESEQLMEESPGSINTGALYLEILDDQGIRCTSLIPMKDKENAFAEFTRAIDSMC